MKRKLAVLILAAVMAGGLMACAGNGSQENSGTEYSAGNGENKTEDAAEGTDEKTSEDAAKEDQKTAIEKAQEARAAAVIGETEIKEKEIPDNEALKFVADMKTGWNLGNTLEAYKGNVSLENELSTEEAWGNPVTTQAMIDEVKKAGFQTIRIPITWRDHVTVSENGEITVSQVWLDRVKEVVDYAYDNGLYVIVNTHHDVALEDGYYAGYYPSGEKYEWSEKYLTAIWTAMAETFRDYDEHLIMESMNEPRLVGTTYEWYFQTGTAECKDAADCINRLNQKFVDTVRATGGNNAERYLMLPGYDASLDGAVTELYQLPSDSADNKLIVSVHAYTPYNFALQAPGESGSTDTFSMESSASTADIDQLMKKLYDKYVSNGIPVVIGEYGAREKNGNLQDRLDYYVYYVSSARASGITCCVWDNNAFSGTGENFGLLRRRVCSWLYPEIVEAIMSCC